MKHYSDSFFIILICSSSELKIIRAKVYQVKIL